MLCFYCLYPTIGYRFLVVLISLLNQEGVRRLKQKVSLVTNA